MKLYFMIKKAMHREKYKEYLTVQQILRNKQLKSTQIFVAVKNDPNRSTATDPELNQINDEANQLCFRYIELDRFFYGKKSKFGSALVRE